ncbi:SDR family oxidoreductase [Mucilaginibacter sp. L3T2-6]|uniref:SDR family oxidoreductase n=1 Tax=Mucilaginibacter sp. L3T2-6 TaxID=3062491 RepID=UPI0026751632|nr:NAD(P)H-binding protein [Mucilaginibacter sp. L3T2-6]MDO3643740.1 NAD(P)H-binding protein [Mucilaginibacter sp. L3T2-6]MDV6216191.1 NAD(P)H-binding protein [Mucilaginibacter sp. L3T2-6]
MEILVVGGTGLIGKDVSRKLADAGHQVIIGSPSKGINIVTGEGLAEALVGTNIVIDLSNSPSPDDETALNFFRAAGKNLVMYEKEASVKHHLVLSIVGTDRVAYIGYLQAKKEQEDNIKNSGIPYTIIRSTQFHEHITTLIAVQGKETEVNISTVDYQPIAAIDVVELVVKLALEEPKNGTIEIAGPERAPMTDFVQRYLNHKGDSKVLISNNDNKYMFFDISKDLLVPLGEFRAGLITFDDWLRAN